jgi:protein phosphatase
MLVCPQCQFENPDSNKFCQKCGTSLSEITCLGCEASVPVDLEHCPHCGAPTGVVWRAILSIPKNGENLLTLGKYPLCNEHPDEVVSESANPALEITLPANYYLDDQERYRLLEPLPELPIEQNGAEVRVLDCKPFYPSLLETFYKWKGEVPELVEPAPKLGAEPASETNAIPAIAKIYLKLQPETYPSLPQVHDAWQQNEWIVLLLEDRASLPSLLAFWHDPDTLPLQILYWMHEIAGLWIVLEPQKACRSLLESTNLKVDEDQILCLQRLYFDDVEAPPSLKDLGQAWLSWFEQTHPPGTEKLVHICADLISGKIVDLEQLHDQLEAIANDLQPDPVRMGREEAQPLPDVSISEDETEVLIPKLLHPSNKAAEPVVATTAIPPANATLLEVSETEDDLVGENDDIPTVVLPMKLISIEDIGRSDVGRQRDHNEDLFHIQADLKKVEGPTGQTLQFKGLYILCDGMGGHASGEVASALAVDTLKQYFQANWKDRLPSEPDIRTAVYLANKAIFDLNQQSDRSGVGRMGTTLLMVLIQDTQVAIAHVGDSRLYRFSRRHGLEQMTADHEVGQREIHRGVEPDIAYARPDAYQLTQALGPRDENFVNPDIQFIELNEDVLLLLCSDGLTDNDLLEINWRTHLEPMLSYQTSLDQGINQLMDLANQFNGHDNITAIAIRARVRPNLEQLKRA